MNSTSLTTTVAEDRGCCLKETSKTGRGCYLQTEHVVAPRPNKFNPWHSIWHAKVPLHLERCSGCESLRSASSLADLCHSEAFLSFPASNFLLKRVPRSSSGSAEARPDRLSSISEGSQGNQTTVGGMQTSRLSF